MTSHHPHPHFSALTPFPSENWFEDFAHHFLSSYLVLRVLSHMIDMLTPGKPVCCLKSFDEALQFVPKSPLKSKADGAFGTTNPRTSGLRNQWLLLNALLKLTSKCRPAFIDWLIHVSFVFSDVLLSFHCFSSLVWCRLSPCFYLQLYRLFLPCCLLSLPSLTCFLFCVLPSSLISSLNCFTVSPSVCFVCQNSVFKGVT